MAKATKIKSVTSYVLELSEDEARALYGLTGIINGDEEGGPRKHTTSIRRALQLVGVHATASEVGFSGSVTSDKPTKYF